MALLERPGRIFFSLLAIVLGVLFADPYKLSPISNVDFTPQLVSLPDEDPSSEVADPLNQLSNSQHLFKGKLFGPESLAFDANGNGPYMSLSDGRVVKWNKETQELETFAYTSPNRSPEICDSDFSGPNLANEHICGRPLGLRFHPQTNQLYIADAYFGLFAVGPEGGKARLITNQAEGIPFKFTNDLDIDEDGTIYFTDTSTKYQRRQFLLEIIEGGAYGRFLKFDPTTNETVVLKRELRFPNGVALSKDRSFVLVAETTLMRIHRYWIKGSRAGTSEIFKNLPGFPDNVRLNSRGRFWVAIHARRNPLISWLFSYPQVRRVLLKLPLNLKIVYFSLIGLPKGLIIELDEDGKITNVLEDRQGKVVKAVSEVEEHDGQLWMGSVIFPFAYLHTPAL